MAGLERTSGEQEARAEGPPRETGWAVLAQDCRGVSEEGTAALAVTGGRLCPASGRGGGNLGSRGQEKGSGYCCKGHETGAQSGAGNQGLGSRTSVLREGSHPASSPGLASEELGGLGPASL